MVALRVGSGEGVAGGFSRTDFETVRHGGLERWGVGLDFDGGGVGDSVAHFHFFARGDQAGLGGEGEDGEVVTAEHFYDLLVGGGFAGFGALVGVASVCIAGVESRAGVDRGERDGDGGVGQDAPQGF